MKLRQFKSIPNFFRNEDSGIFYTKRMVNGRVVWRTTGHTAEKSALRRHHEIMNELADAKSGWDAKKVPTLAEWWGLYRKAKTKAAATWDRNGYDMKNMLGQFGRLELTKLTPNQFERYFNWRRRQVAEGTVNNEISTLKAVLNAAMEEGLIDKSPARRIKKTRVKPKDRVLDRDEEVRLLGVLAPVYQRWLTFMLGTGLRIDEATKLTPAGIDWQAPSITVVGKGSRTRTVPLLDSRLVEILRTQVEPGGPFVWPHNTRDGAYREVLTAACTAAHVLRFTPHMLRHTFATRYLQSGGDIFILSKLLGHASVRMTERVYAHLLTADHAKLSAHVDLGLSYGKPVEIGVEARERQK